MASVLFGANVSWKDSNSSGSWSDGTKWSTAAPPQTGDTPYLDKTNIEVTRTAANANDVFLQFYGPGIAATNAVLNIEGGSMNVNRISTSNETFRIAYGTGSSGRVNMSGGLIEVGDFVSGLGDLQVGRSGTGELFMTGGEIRIARYLYVGSTSTGGGHVKIYGDAVIRVGNSLFRGSTSYSKIDIGGGQLIFTGDKRQHVAAWKAGGWLVAYEGHSRAQLIVNYDVTANETIVTAAIPNVNLAYNPFPADADINVQCGTLSGLEWSAGENAIGHHVYFGTEYNAVLNAEISDSTGIFCGILQANILRYPLAEPLILGQSYYWRIDEVNDACIRKGDVWSFGIDDNMIEDDPCICGIDFDDFVIFGKQWLVEAENSHGLTAHLKFDEGSGIIAGDVSGLGNNGTLVNNPIWTTGYAGGLALDFTATNLQYVVVPDNSSISVGRGNYTLSCRIMTRSLYESSVQGIVIAKIQDGSEKEYMLSINRGRLYLNVEQAGNNGWAYTPDYVIKDSAWHHIAATFDARTLQARLYVDGVSKPIVENTINRLPTVLDSDLCIGACPYYNWGFDGKIDDVRIYDQKLSDFEVAQLAQGIEPSITPVLRPLDTSADIIKDNKVEFKDLLELSRDWLAPRQFRLPAIISDNMVLQAGVKVPVWGWAEPGESVTVNIAGQTHTTSAGINGKWMVKLDEIAAQSPIKMTVCTSNDSITVKNILVGEVWLASGQSNMEKPVQTSFNAQQEIQDANYPLIRMFNVTKINSLQPLDDCCGRWEMCSPSNVGTFSAAAYFFGRDLHKAIQRPVGLILSYWSGTAAETWTPRETLTSDSDLATILNVPYDPDGKNYPSSLYNGMINPLIPFGIKGVIWYQGESNTARAYQYRKLFPAMITGWRSQWNQGDFEFLFVQLTNYTAPLSLPGSWAELREAQTMTLALDNTGMIVTVDIGEADNVHAMNKQDVGYRLSLAALAKVYGSDIEYSGPMYKRYEVLDGKVIISFDHAAGLHSKNGALKEFQVASADMVFVDANAVIISDDQIEVSNPSVPTPVAVRYGWSNNPEYCNLYNSADLPASPFRTDDWAGVTEGW